MVAQGPSAATFVIDGPLAHHLDVPALEAGQRNQQSGRRFLTGVASVQQPPRLRGEEGRRGTRHRRHHGRQTAAGLFLLATLGTHKPFPVLVVESATATAEQNDSSVARRAVLGASIATALQVVSESRLPGVVTGTSAFDDSAPYR